MQQVNHACSRATCDTWCKLTCLMLADDEGQMIARARFNKTAHSYEQLFLLATLRPM